MNLKTYILILASLILYSNLFAQSIENQIDNIKVEFQKSDKHASLKEKYSNEDYDPYLTVYMDSKNKKQKTYIKSILKSKSVKKDDVILCGKFKENQNVEFIKIIEKDSVVRTKSRHILLVDKSDEKINMIFEKLKSGEKFEDLAKQYSQDGSRGRGGFLGYYYSGELLQEFEEAIILHPVGEAFIIKTIFGYHILKKLYVIRPSSLYTIQTSLQ